jgi:DNA-directed RNA polymerase subunit alpha
MDGQLEMDQVLAKESWTLDEVKRMSELLAQVNDPVGRFRELLFRAMASTPAPAGAAAVKFGMAKYMLCQFQEALALLGNGTDNKERRYYQALCQVQLHQYDKAIENFERAVEKGWDSRAVTLKIAESHILYGDLPAAGRSLERFAKSSQEDADWHYVSGLLAERQGNYKAALESYEAARKLRPGHPEASFRLAYFYDLHGDEEQALEFYRQCVMGSTGQFGLRPVYANALLNMAVLYEDEAEYDDAIRCLRRILAGNPGNRRAQLFLRDAQSSKTMVFDEDEAKRISRRNDLLGIPVTDFELSVRARNCLKKMNIRTLGDLLHVTEPELLSYKNFGETSLAEIKQMLSTKNLRLGQLREEGDSLHALAEPIPSPATPASPGVSEGVLSTPLSQIEFSVRARRAMQRLGVSTLGDLAAKSEAELLACRNFGQTSLNEVQQRLTDYGLTLRESQ